MSTQRQVLHMHESVHMQNKSLHLQEEALSFMSLPRKMPEQIPTTSRRQSSFWEGKGPQVVVTYPRKTHENLLHNLPLTSFPNPLQKYEWNILLTKFSQTVTLAEMPTICKPFLMKSRLYKVPDQRIILELMIAFGLKLERISSLYLPPCTKFQTAA